MTAPLMPKATAVWLVENTTLTFRQIAFFCELHELEIQAIADGDVAFNIIGISPLSNGQLTAEEIVRCEGDKAANLQANPLERNVKENRGKAKKILSPSQRGDKPSAILWIIKNCPDIMDSQICKLIGTTKPTIAAIRGGTYKDMANLKPKNPVAIGLCSEKDLEKALKISVQRLEPKAKKPKKVKKAKVVKVKAEKKAKPAKKAAKKVKKAAAKKVVAVKKTVKKKVVVKKAAAKKATAKKPAVKAKKAVKKTTAKKAKKK